MNIKALLGVAAISAVALSAVAQSNVYSLNVVGYVNIPLGAGVKTMIANQLNTTNNTIGSLLPAPVPGTTLFKYAGGFSSYTFDPDDLVWYPDALATLNPGEGAFVISPTATTLTFVGEVLQGALSNPTPLNTKVIRSSMVPQAGLLTTDLKLTGEPGDTVFKYAGGYSAFTFDPDDLVWYPNEPSVNVGESFFLLKASTATQTAWVRNFTVQ